MRFFYGLPFAALWLVVAWLGVAGGRPLPPVNPAFLGWTVVASLSQIAATALLLRCMQERNFALGVAYAKTEVIQVALFGLVLLGDRVSALSVAAILVATAGVVLVSLPADNRSLRRDRSAAGPRARRCSASARVRRSASRRSGIAAPRWRSTRRRSCWPPPIRWSGRRRCRRCCSAAVCCGGSARVVVAVLRAWRVSMLAGAMGAIGSACWFTAMALEPVANVRTLGLIELYFSYLVSRRFFRERLRPAELAGFVLLALGLLGVLGQR